VFQGNLGKQITMMGKILITIYEEDVAPRFDLSSEVFIASLNDKGEIVEKKR